MNKFKKIIIAVGLLGLSSSVMAIPSFTGSIGFVGTSTVTDDGTTATGINYGEASVSTATGTFASFSNILNTYTSGHATTLLLASLGHSVPNSMVMNDLSFSATPLTLWSIDVDNDTSVDISFTLTSVSIGAGNTAPYTALTLRGAGFFSGTGFADTYSSWTHTQAGSQFSSVNVPEPAILALLSMGLIGIGAVRKLRK